MSTVTATADDGGVDTAGVVELVRWQPISDPVDHGSSCCTTARRWLGAVHAGGGATTPLSALDWIADMYPWGPSRWPMSWCKLVEQDQLDCGAHSAIAREVVGRAGPGLLGVQLLIRATASDIAHWSCTWRDHGVAPGWLFDRLYYHEAVGCADEDLVVFDPTRNWRIPPEGRTEDGSVAAIRVSGGHHTTVPWGGHELVMGEWTVLGPSGAYEG